MKLKFSMDSDLQWRLQTIPGPDKMKEPKYISPFDLNTLSNSPNEEKIMKQKANYTGSIGFGAIEGKSSSNGQ